MMYACVASELSFILLIILILH